MQVSIKSKVLLPMSSQFLESNALPHWQADWNSDDSVAGKMPRVVLKISSRGQPRPVAVD